MICASFPHFKMVSGTYFNQFKQPFRIHRKLNSAVCILFIPNYLTIYINVYFLILLPHSLFYFNLYEMCVLYSYTCPYYYFNNAKFIVICSGMKNESKLLHTRFYACKNLLFSLIFLIFHFIFTLHFHVLVSYKKNQATSCVI